ncbi:MAG TPA: oligosaccharide flippase family protein [Gemmatimonadales bacterium]|nr:oligosaccharide flippase family protein [Gemmatimonadales bacterium]
MKAFWRSPTIRSGVVYAAAGLGFAGANLILARVLPTAEYGLFTLIIAMVNLGHALGTGGIDGVVTRRHLEATPELLLRSASAALLIAAGLTIVAGVAYHLAPWMLLVVFVSTATGGVMMVASARFQSEQRFGISLALMQSPNLVLMVAAIVVVLSSATEAWLPLSIAAVGFVVAACIGWGLLLIRSSRKPRPDNSFPWGDAFSFAGVNAAGLLLVQLDRLIIPHVLTVHELATYGVLAAIAGSLFRVLSMGVGYTMVPRLRDAPGVLQRRALVAHEAKLVGVLIVAGSAVIWVVTPLVEEWFLAGKYHLTGSLVLAALVGGVAKIANSFTKSVVSAVGTSAELIQVNLLGWGAVALAIPAALLGARWGLAGLMYGVALGWMLNAGAGLYFALRHLRLPTSVPVTAP